MSKDEEREEFLRKYTENAKLVLRVVNREREKKAKAQENPENESENNKGNIDER